MDDSSAFKIKASLDTIAQVLARKEGYCRHNEKFLVIKAQLETTLNSELMQTGNHVSGNLCLEWLQVYLSKLLAASNKVSSKFDKYIGTDIESLTLKISYLASQLEAALKLSHKDLASLADDHPRVVALKSHTTTIDVITAEDMKSELERFLVPYNTFKGMIHQITKFKQSKWRKVMAGYTLLYYLIAKKELKRLIAEFDAKATNQQSLMLWRLIHSNLLRKALGSGMQKIYLDKQIYIPRMFPHVLLNETSNPISSNSMYTEIHDKIKLGIRINHCNPIRGLMPMTKEAENENIETIIIFIHGGGLVAGTNFESQFITRGFANETKIPVFSLEYRLAPEFPFPAAVDDVWQSYHWILNYSYEYFKFRPNKIIVVGESAGCNLAVTLTNRLIETKGRVPDSLFFAYPFLSQDTKYFSKSSILSLEDQMLPFTFEKLVDDCYKSDLDSTHYLLSPVYTPSKNIKHFPKTRIIIPLFDPLSFNGLRFAEKLVSKGRDVHIYEIPNAIHACVSFGNKANIPKLIKAYDAAVSIIKDLTI